MDASQPPHFPHPQPLHSNPACFLQNTHHILLIHLQVVQRRRSVSTVTATLPSISPILPRTGSPRLPGLARSRLAILLWWRRPLQKVYRPHGNDRELDSAGERSCQRLFLDNGADVADKGTGPVVAVRLELHEPDKHVGHQPEVVFQPVVVQNEPTLGLCLRQPLVCHRPQRVPELVRPRKQLCLGTRLQPEVRLHRVKVLQKVSNQRVALFRRPAQKLPKRDPRVVQMVHHLVPRLTQSPKHPPRILRVHRLYRKPLFQQHLRSILLHLQPSRPQLPHRLRRRRRLDR